MDRVLSCIGRVMFASLVTDLRATGTRSISLSLSLSLSYRISKSTDRFVLLPSSFARAFSPLALRSTYLPWAEEIHVLSHTWAIDRCTHPHTRTRVYASDRHTGQHKDLSAVRWILYGPVLDLRPTRLGALGSGALSVVREDC